MKDLLSKITQSHLSLGPGNLAWFGQGAKSQVFAFSVFPLSRWLHTPTVVI